MDSPQHREEQEQQQQHEHQQEVPSKESPVRAAPLHHAIVKPEGLELNTTGIRKPSLGQKELTVTVGHGGETEEKMVTVLKKKKNYKKIKARVLGYLDFTSFHQRTVKLLSGPLCIRARLKRNKAEALRAREGKETTREKQVEDCS